MNQLQGTFEYIDQDYVLAGIKSQLGLRETTAEDMVLLDNINQIVKELRNFGTMTYVVTQLQLDHTSGTPKVKMPNGFIRFVKKNPIVYVTAEGTVTNGVNNGTVELVTSEDDGTNLGVLTLPSMLGYGNYSSPVFVNNAFYKDSPYGGINGLCGTVNLVDGWLYFSDNVIADYIKIAYLGTNFGDNGKIVIPSYAELAVRYGACEMWSTTQFAITGEQRYRVMMQDFQTKYARHKAKAKVIAVMPSSEEYEFINYTFSTLI